MGDPYNHQQEALQMLLRQSNGGGALLALAPRLGKAVVSIQAAIAANKCHTLIVCPLTLARNWRMKIMEWGSQTTESIQLCRGKRPEPIARWVIANYDTIRTKGVTPGFDLIVFDESVLLKNRRAARTKACRSAVLACRKADSLTSVWALSGSPTTKLLDDLWSQLNILDHRRFASYWRFVDTYCVKEITFWGTSVKANQPRAEERLKHDLADVYFCVNQEDIISTEPFYLEKLDIPMLPAQQRMYDTMEKEFFAQLSALEDDVVLAPNTLVRLIRLIQIASNPVLLGGSDISPKMDAVLEMLGYSDLPIIVWTGFVDTARNLSMKIADKHYRVAILTGDTPVEERQNIVDIFQDGGLDVLVAHPKVGKFGLELYNAKSAVFLERSYDGDDFYQALHRMRLATSPTSHVTLLLSSRIDGKPTVDHAIDAVLTRAYSGAQRLTAKIMKNALGAENAKTK